MKLISATLLQDAGLAIDHNAIDKRIVRFQVRPFSWVADLER